MKSEIENKNPRFVWTIGAIREVYPDLPSWAG